MRNIYIILVVLLSSTLSWGQITLNEGEYFWDTDPGEGSGIPFTTSDGNYNTTIESILQSNIPVPTVGLHTFNVRVKDSNNEWGLVFTQVIDVSTAPIGNNAIITLVEAEYFWDADPGEGNGIAFSAEDGNYDSVLEDLLEIGISIVGPAGLHVFNIRVKDANNEWGPVFAQIIDIESTLSIYENELDIEVLVYPNPTSDYVLVKTSEEKLLNVKIYNVTGGLVKTIDLKTDLSRKINIEDLPNATYLILIKSTRGQIVKKIIKN